MTMNVRERDFKVLYAMLLGAQGIEITPSLGLCTRLSKWQRDNEIKGLWGAGKPVAGGKGDQKDQAGVGLHPTTDQGGMTRGGRTRANAPFANLSFWGRSLTWKLYVVICDE